MVIFCRPFIQSCVEHCFGLSILNSLRYRYWITVPSQLLFWSENLIVCNILKISLYGRKYCYPRKNASFVTFLHFLA